MSDDEHTTHQQESYDYGRLWADGTFEALSSYSEKYGRQQFEEKTYELKHVPESLRPVFGRRKTIKTTDTYKPEPVPEP